MRHHGGIGLLRIAFSLVALLLAVVLVSALAGRLQDDPRPAVAADRRAAAAGAGLPDPVQPAFVPPAPRKLSRLDDVSWWSPVGRSTIVRARPDENAPVIGRLSTRTPEGTRNLVLVLGRHRDARGVLWVRARLPILPNDTSGWVRRSALGGYSAVSTRLVVDVQKFTATLYRNGKRIFQTEVGVGLPENPTPRGEFYVRNKLRRYANAFYGPVAFGTSARSPTLTDWPAGGFVGIHGTNRPDLLPGRVSHGCIRLRNDDILALERLMPVGTPLTIV
jgi:L,D-transpeptidase-like protein